MQQFARIAATAAFSAYETRDGILHLFRHADGGAFVSKGPETLRYRTALRLLDPADDRERSMFDTLCAVMCETFDESAPTRFFI